MRIIRALIVMTAACISLLTGGSAIPLEGFAFPCEGLAFPWEGLAIAQPLPKHSAPETHWSYQAATGPNHWAELDPAFAACKNGQGQSPINLTATESADLTDPEFHYSNAPLNLLNNGHTIQMPYAPGSYVTLDGQRYDLLQLHFHSPSEHAINNQLSDAELHLVHQNDKGEIAVVAVLLKTDEVNDSADDFEQLSENLPAIAGDKIRTGKTINAQNLLPSQTTTYRYSGSLTTPPCSESVTWLVMSEPVSLPSVQMTRYKKLLNHNNRPLQLQQSRSVKVDLSIDVKMDISP